MVDIPLYYLGALFIGNTQEHRIPDDVFQLLEETFARSVVLGIAASRTGLNKLVIRQQPSEGCGQVLAPLVRMNQNRQAFLLHGLQFITVQVHHHLIGLSDQTDIHAL